MQTIFEEQNPGTETNLLGEARNIFAQHLSILSNQVVVRNENVEPPVITRAKEYIHEHQSEELSLGQVAKAVNMSTCYY